MERLTRKLYFLVTALMLVGLLLLPLAINVSEDQGVTVADGDSSPCEGGGDSGTGGGSGDSRGGTGSDGCALAA